MLNGPLRPAVAATARNALAWARRAICTCRNWWAAIESAAVAHVDLGRIDERADMIQQLLQTQPHARIDLALFAARTE